MKRCQFSIFSSNLDEIMFRKRAQKRSVSFNLKISEVKAVVSLGHKQNPIHSLDTAVQFW
jgi:hypothetical protein